jgi:hypothetical protein
MKSSYRRSVIELNVVTMGAIRTAIFCVLASLTLAIQGSAQNQHNFIVPPETNSCDSIKFNQQSLSMAVEVISQTIFRFQQNISINREKGFKEASFYSCDNLHGYMLIKYHNLHILYSEMPLSLWESMINSGNPGEYYEKNIKDQYAFWLSEVNIP